MKERMGLPKSSMQKIAAKAYEYGLTRTEANGSLKRYFDSLYLSHNTANNIRAYGDEIYLFNGSVLITVIDLPNYYKKIVHKKLKEKNILKSA